MCAGLSSIVLASLVGKLGNIFVVMSAVSGAILGPMHGMFLSGFLLPFVNRKVRFCCPRYTNIKVRNFITYGRINSQHNRIKVPSVQSRSLVLLHLLQGAMTVKLLVVEDG